MTQVWEDERIDTRRADWGRDDVEKLNAILDRMLAARPELRAAVETPIDWDAVNATAMDEWRAAKAKTLALHLPERYQQATCRHAASQAWVNEYDAGMAPNLVIRGAAGQGKTWEACAVARQLLQRSVPTLFVEVPEMLDQLRPKRATEEQADMAAYASARVLVLDDLGAEQTRDWGLEQLYRLFNHRHNHMLPTIVTTNLEDADLVQRYGQRIGRRILQGAVKMTVVRRPEIVR
jgi:DNA replication protein DnaC